MGPPIMAPSMAFPSSVMSLPPPPLPLATAPPPPLMNPFMMSMPGQVPPPSLPETLELQALAAEEARYWPPPRYAATTKEGELNLTDGFTYYKLQTPITPRRSPTPVILMLHGLGMDTGCWDSYVDPFLMEGFAVLRYDLYERGKSRAHAGTHSHFTPERYILQAVEFLHTVPHPPDLALPTVDIWMGVSTGCPVGALTCHARPGLIKHLILIDPAIGRTSKTWTRQLIEPCTVAHPLNKVALPIVFSQYKTQVEGYYRPQLPSEIPDRLVKHHLFPLLFEPTHWGNSDYRRKLRHYLMAIAHTNADLFNTTTATDLLEKVFASIPGQYAPCRPPPLLLIWSNEDNICPIENAPKMIAYYGQGNVTFHTLAGRSHMGAFEIPSKALGMILPWVAQHFPRGAGPAPIGVPLPISPPGSSFPVFL